MYDNKEEKFNALNLKIFTQDCFVITSGKEKQLNMPSDFTLENKGGLKNVLFLENKIFGLRAPLFTSSSEATILDLILLPLPKLL